MKAFLLSLFLPLPFLLNILLSSSTSLLKISRLNRKYAGLTKQQAARRQQLVRWVRRSTLGIGSERVLSMLENYLSVADLCRAKNHPTCTLTAIFYALLWLIRIFASCWHIIPNLSLFRFDTITRPHIQRTHLSPREKWSSSFVASVWTHSQSSGIAMSS